MERAKQLVRNGSLSHDFEYVKRRFAEEGVCWQGFGEIIAYNSTGDYERFGQQWFNSQAHHDIMLGDYTDAGGSRESWQRRPILRGHDLREALRRVVGSSVRVH